MCFFRDSWWLQLLLFYYIIDVCVCVYNVHVYYAPTVLHTNRPGRFCHVLCTARAHGLRCCSYYTHSPLYPTPIIIGVISTVTNFSFFPLLLISSVVCSACASDPASLFLAFTPLWHFYTVVIHNDRRRRHTAPLSYINRYLYNIYEWVYNYIM